MSKPRFLTLVGIIAVAALSRLVPHPWNFTPVAAMALFAGAQFSDIKSAFLVPLAALLLSDLVLGFYSTMPVIYVCFALTVLIGRGLRRHRTALGIVSASVATSVIFFVVSNFFCWVFMPEYTKDFSGFTSCYALALPFFRNSLAGDLFFNTVLFGGFALSEKAFPQLQESAQLA